LFLFDINNIQFLFIDLLIYLIIFNSVKCNLAKCPTPLKYIFKIKYYFIILLLFYYYLCKNYMQKNFKIPFIFYFFFFFWIVWLLHTAHSQLISTALRSSTAFRAQSSRLFPWAVLRNGTSGVFKVYLHIVFA